MGSLAPALLLAPTRSCHRYTFGGRSHSIEANVTILTWWNEWQGVTRSSRRYVLTFIYPSPSTSWQRKKKAGPTSGHTIIHWPVWLERKPDVSLVVPEATQTLPPRSAGPTFSSCGRGPTRTEMICCRSPRFHGVRAKIPFDAVDIWLPGVQAKLEPCQQHTPSQLQVDTKSQDLESRPITRDGQRGCRSCALPLMRTLQRHGTV